MLFIFFLFGRIPKSKTTTKGNFSIVDFKNLLPHEIPLLSGINFNGLTKVQIIIEQFKVFFFFY